MIDRRRLLTLTATAALGVGAGFAGARLSGEQASIRFIGDRNSMIALLDTGQERVIFVVGEQNDALTKNVANLVTVGNGRIDLVVATHRVLATRAAREYLGIEEVTTVCLQSDMSLPAIRGKVKTTAHNMDITLGNTATLSIRPQGPAPVNADHPEYIGDIRIQGIRMLIGSSLSALRRANVGRADLLAVTGAVTDEILGQVEPSLVVCNSPLEASDAAQMQVFWNDPVIVRIDDGAIRFRPDQLSS